MPHSICGNFSGQFWQQDFRRSRMFREQMCLVGPQIQIMFYRNDCVALGKIRRVAPVGKARVDEARQIRYFFNFFNGP